MSADNNFFKSSLVSITIKVLKILHTLIPVFAKTF